jgi:TonB-linked SusC/RagA family outer membrane protein
MKQFISVIFIYLCIHNYSYGQASTNNIKADTLMSENQNICNKQPSHGAISIFNVENFNRGVVFTPMQLIKGKVPGMAIVSTNGNDPNPSLQIQTRGFSTLFLNTNPLYVIDGIPVESPELVSPENIESIEVLKSLSESAAYGIRGCNGVVLINTKRDYSKLLTVKYSTYGYISTYAKNPEYLSASEWRQFKNDLASSTYSQLSDHSKLMDDYNASTNWENEISQSKFSQVHNLGFSGRYHKTSYSVNFSYSTHNGVIQKTGNNILTGQVYISQLALKDRLRVSFSLMGSSRNYNQINDNPYLNRVDAQKNTVISNFLTYANYYNPTVPIYNSDGSYGSDSLSYSLNPVQKLRYTTDKHILNNQLANFQASYEIIKRLKISASLSEYRISNEYSLSTLGYATEKAIRFEVRDENSKLNETIVNTKLSYTKPNGNHHFNLSLGYSVQINKTYYQSRDSSAINDNFYSSKSIGSSENILISGISVLAKYDYKNRYYLTIGLMQEESLLYSYKGGKQYYPSVSAAWSVGNEDFLKNTPWLSCFGIRFNYGTGKRSYRDGNLSVQNSLPNNDIHGENMHEINFGVDWALFSNRISLTVEHYNRITKDIIINSSLPDNSMGYSSFISNDASIQNKGWEFTFKAQPVLNPLKWVFDINFSLNSNEILSFKKQSFQITEGQPVGNFRGRIFGGYNESEVNTNKVIYLDDNGDIIPQLNGGYYKTIGNGAPKSYFGFTNTFTFRRFDLSVFAYGALGFDIKNSTKLDDYFRNSNYQKAVLIADQRDVLCYSSLLNTDYVIEKGDYLKIDNISLGYTIPLKKRYIQSAKIYVACNSVATFTSFSGGDPEMADITGINPGNYYYNKYPNTRIFQVGLKATF